MMQLRWADHFRSGRRGLVVRSSPNCRRIVVYFPDVHEYEWRWATACVEAEVVPSIEDGEEQAPCQQVHVVTELPLLHRRVVSFA